MSNNTTAIIIYPDGYPLLNKIDSTTAKFSPYGLSSMSIQS